MYDVKVKLKKRSVMAICLPERKRLFQINLRVFYLLLNHKLKNHALSD